MTSSSANHYQAYYVEGKSPIFLTLFDGGRKYFVSTTSAELKFVTFGPLYPTLTNLLVSLSIENLYVCF